MANNAGSDDTLDTKASQSIEITRTFSPFRESESEETDFEYWFQHAHGRQTTWPDLLKCRLVVVVGEAGIGKTYEFKEQSRRLRRQGDAAFFIPLNLLQRPEDWELALDDQSTDFGQWTIGQRPGFFFLDAVDEARLTGPTALRRAFNCVRRALADHLVRVSFCVSSRISDWNLLSVRELIEQQLSVPTSLPVSTAISTKDVLTTSIDSTDAAVKFSVYRLEPLSAEAARRLAVHYGVSAVEAFWQEVEDGDYEFLASRPLDLQWMAARWRDAGRLGSFADLIESAVANRLVERNPGYEDAGAVLSPDQLRNGAETLAAASVFSGSAYVQVQSGEAPGGAIAPAAVLGDWKPIDHQRLLGSAVFDEATYGRVQFHHRSVREYLAACWMKRQLDQGLPFAHAWRIFARSPFGQEVLVPTRRASLCWLAALDAKVRGHVIRSFPEMVLFEGDPQRWSSDDVVDAVDRVLDKLRFGYQPDWWNYASEFRRLSRMIPSGVLSSWIERYRSDPAVMNKLLMVVKHGRMTECAEQIFALYRTSEQVDGLHLHVLNALQSVATPAQRDAITKDILTGRLSGNKSIAEGIKAIGVEHMTVEQLAGCFGKAEAERAFGGGALAMAVKVDLLPEVSLTDAKKLLAALLSALPTMNSTDLSRRFESGKQREEWILAVLPDVLLRVLELTPILVSNHDRSVMDGALIVEDLRHTSYAHDEDFRKLRAALARFPELRKAVALRIAMSNIPHGLSSLTWMSGIVYFDHEDLPWLIGSANNAENDTCSRKVWYTAARDIAMRRLRGKPRQNMLRQLLSGPEADERRRDLDELARQRRAELRQQRNWKHESIAHKQETRRSDAANRRELLKRLDKIRAGTAFDAIRWLVETSAARGNRSGYTTVDIEVVRNVFGSEIAGAFNDGLTQAWRHIDAPDSRQYVDNRVPWAGLIGLASANHALQHAMDVTGLADDEVKKLVRLCVWDINKPEPWFAQLVQSRTSVAREALIEWFEFELALPQEGARRRTIEMVLSGPPALKQALLANCVEPIKTGNVTNERLRRELLFELWTAKFIDVALVERLAVDALQEAFAASPQTFASEWFGCWAKADASSALAWFKTNRRKWVGNQAELVEQLAGAIDMSASTARADASAEQIVALADLFQILDAQLAETSILSEGTSGRTNTSDLWNRVPNALASLRGKAAYQALIDLAKARQGTQTGSWLMNKAREQASLYAEEEARIFAEELHSLGDPFTREPRTEGELFEQVMARLREIAEGIEKGPFSERGLFPFGIQEKQLQLWLAARLEDTPRRRFTARFSISREPTVDADKRTDIEVSTTAGKVCIEIKPLDGSRSYSAKSLTDDTLNRQLVGQYLRGKNSRHGVLVVFRLDRKTWQIPGIAGSADFRDLAAYLETHAREVAAVDQRVMRLEVVPIDCTMAPS